MKGSLLDLAVLLAALDDRLLMDSVYTPQRGELSALKRLKKRKLMRPAGGGDWVITPYGMRWLGKLRKAAGKPEWWRNPDKHVSYNPGKGDDER